MKLPKKYQPLFNRMKFKKDTGSFIGENAELIPNNKEAEKLIKEFLKDIK